MERREMIAEITRRFDIKLDENDPAFVLVELNRLAMNEAGHHVLDQLERIPELVDEALKQSWSALPTANFHVEHEFSVPKDFAKEVVAAVRKTLANSLESMLNEKGAFERDKAIFEEEKRRFDQLSLWDRIFFRG